MAKPGLSLQELMGEFPLTEKQLNEEVSEAYLKDASRDIADHESLGRELGLTQAEMTAIGPDKTMDVKRSTMLTIWKQKFAFRANYRTLIKAYLKCRRADLAQDLCKFVRRISSEQTSARVPEPSPISIPAPSHFCAAGTDVAQPAHHDLREEQTPGQNTDEFEVMTPAKKLKKDEDFKMQSNEELRDLPEKNNTSIAQCEKKIADLDEQVKTLKTQLMEEKLSRQEREFLEKLKGRQPTPPIGDYVESKGIRYNMKHHCVGGNTYEVMILVSVGSRFPGVKVQDRVKDPVRAEEANQTYSHLPIKVPGLHKEAAADLKAVVGMRLQDYSGDLVRLCQDVPGKHHSKAYYLEAIEEHIKQCQQPAVVLYYMGDSQEDTGNWCFKDGTISFKEIFDLYRRHHLGKPLIIHSDCCYSGNWTYECAKMLDNHGIPACGHMAREEKILIKVYASCQRDEMAHEPEYSVKGAIVEENRTITFCNRELPHQTPSVIDTTRLICCKGPDELCRWEEVLKNWTWQKELKKPCQLI